MRRILFILFAINCSLFTATAQPKRIDLSGTWQFALDRQGTMKADDGMTETV